MLFCINSHLREKIIFACNNLSSSVGNKLTTEENLKQTQFKKPNHPFQDSIMLGHAFGNWVFESNATMKIAWNRINLLLTRDDMEKSSIIEGNWTLYFLKLGVYNISCRRLYNALF